MNPVVRLDDVSVGYRTLVVLAGVSAELHAGELVCLVGPNGAGKSTLLRTIAGLQPALGGRLLLDGRAVGQLRRNEIARLLATVLTDRVDPGRLRARELVALGRHPHTDWTGRLGEADHAIVDGALQRVGAGHLADQELDQLSDGQRQRILVARALAQQPRALLLDEPTAFLDPPARIGLLALLGEVAANEGVAVLVSTHDVELAARCADTLWAAGRDGRMTVGGPEDLVHSGALGTLFGDEGAEFDPSSLGFRAVRPASRVASVRGNGLAAVLASHALRRAGYRIARDLDAPDVHVTVGPGVHTTVEAPSGTHHDDLADLARHARSLTQLPQECTA